MSSEENGDLVQAIKSGASCWQAQAEHIGLLGRATSKTMPA